MKDDNLNFKIFINKIHEDWIVDRLKEEFLFYSRNIVTNNVRKSDIIWIIAPWTWKNISQKFLKTKKVVCTIHHIDEDKFNSETAFEFYKRDSYVDLYHAISQKTFDQLKKYTDKKIILQPFWVDKNKWFYIDNKDDIKKKYKISKDEFIIGSFQRDSEGHNTKLPKLSKGPDRLIEIIRYYKTQNPNLNVLLTGKRRDYIINELNKYNINFHFYEMVEQETMNEFYNLLDLYIVSSRYEGGPFSIYESAMTKTPIISTDVGIASEILSKDSIYSMKDFKNAVPNVKYAYNKVQEFTIEKIIPKYYEMFKSVYES